MMTANVEIIVAEMKNIFVLPINAVYRQGDKRFVKVLGSSGNIEEKYVEIGLSNNDYVEVIKGIGEKEEIILSGENENSYWTKKTNPE